MDQFDAKGLLFPTALTGGAQGLFHVTKATPQAHVIIAIGAGYLDEPDELPGLAHLLEHTLLTQPGPDGRSLLSITQQLGGKLNARTDDVLTDIHATLPTASLPTFLECLGQALFAPSFDEATINTEVGAINAEYQARDRSPAMLRLAGLRRLATNGHPAARCHHGSRQSLSLAASTLASKLKRFHNTYYTPPLIAVGITAPVALSHQIVLTEQVLHSCTQEQATFASCHPMLTPRWSSTHRHQHYEAPVAQTEYLWRLPKEHLAHRMMELQQWERALNTGALAKALTGVVNDYHVKLCPSGATDTISMTAYPSQNAERYLPSQTTAIVKAMGEAMKTWQAQPEAAQCPSGIGWEPSLSTWLFAQTRQQAISQHYAFMAPPVSATALFDVTMPYTLSTSSSTIAPKPIKRVITSSEKPADAISWVGNMGCPGLPPHWLACFVPKRALQLPDLAQKQLAAEGIQLQQRTTPRGSWLCAHGENPIVKRLIKMLQQSVTVPLPALEGLQAHRLLAELEVAPSAPSLWANNGSAAASLAPILASLTTSRSLKETQRETSPAEDWVTLMRTFRLAGSDTTRTLLALAAQYHSAPFFRAMRQTHQLGYVAAVRYIDGAPASLAYIVQCAASDIERVKHLVQTEINHLWDALLTCLYKESFSTPAAFAHLNVPETRSAMLVAQWTALLQGVETPLYRIAPQECRAFSSPTWRRWLDDPSHWRWYQRPG